jgi:structure-specific endonuclease subunit SLX1
MDDSMMKKPAAVADPTTSDTAVEGIHALNVTHAPLKPHIEKSQALLASPQTCTLCSSSLPLSGASTLTCPSASCTSKTHLTCLATHFLNTENNGKKTATNNNPTPTPSLLPTTGSCPSCNTPLHWRDLVQELSLRMRGSKELEVLFKPPRKTRKNATAGAAAVEEEEDDDDEEEEEDPEAANGEPELGDEEDDDEVVADEWHQLSESEGEIESIAAPISTGAAAATRLVAANSSKTAPSFRMPKEITSTRTGAKDKASATKKKQARSKGPEVMVEDSDLDDDVEIIA